MFKALYRKFRHLLLPAIIISLIIGANTAFAAEDSYHDFLQTWGRLLSLIGSLINVIIWIVIKFIGDLLTNDYIFGSGMDEMLNSIWQTVRNFVNLAFVFVLLVIAFYNIISIDPEKIPLKKSLGKVAIALILVNFSYFAAKVVLDTANILTTAAFAIPRDIITNLQLSTAEDEYGVDALHSTCAKKFYQGDTSVDMEQLATDESLIRSESGGPYHTDPSGSYLLLPTKCHIPNLVKVKLFKDGVELPGTNVVSTQYDEMKVYLYYQAPAATQNGPLPDPIDVDYRPYVGADNHTYQSVKDFNDGLQGAELSADKFGRNTITMILAKTMFDLNKLTEVSSASSTGFFGLTISGIINLILLLLYGVMFIAMFIVLIFRVVYLWVCIAFSPLIALMFVFKDFGVEMPADADIQKLFIQYAFVPVKMGIALSVGVLMLFKANQQGIMQTTTTIGEAGADIQIPIDTLVNDSSISKLMWNIATVAVIWIAIKWSLSDLSGPVKGIVDKLTGYVDAVGDLAAKAPLALPIAPYANLSENGERQMTTAGALFSALGPTNMSRILNDKIYGVSKGDRKLNQILSNKLDRITTNVPTQRSDLADITKNDDYMSNIMKTENIINRNKLADKLQIMGALNDTAVKKWKSDEGSSPEGFRRMLLSMEGSNPQAKKEFFGDKPLSQTAWAAGGQSSLASMRAVDLGLVGDSVAANLNQWADSGEFAAKKATIETKIVSVQEVKAQEAIRNSLKAQADDRDHTKYNVAKTETVLNEAVDALNNARNKSDDERKKIEAALSAEAKSVYTAAIGSIEKKDEVSDPAAPAPKK